MCGERGNSSFLVVRLRGGLGNQMFEYAAAYSIAQRNRVPLVVDAHSGFVGDRFGRRFELSIFSLSATIYENGMAPTPCFIAKKLREYLRVREYIAMNYLGRNYDPVIDGMKVRGPVLFDAYCQSYLYFKDIEDDIRKELSFSELPTGIDLALAAEIKETNSVCLHARRQYGLLADGTTSATLTQYYGACNMEYYLNALRELRKKQDSLQVYIFSDDVQWAHEHLREFAMENCHLQVVDDADTLRCFYLMQSCRHFIIANSTYSWWAAWLGNHPAKNVFAPSVWSNGPKAYPQGLIPDTWRKI